MKKEVKKYGNTFVITLTKEDMRVHDIHLGDVLEIHKSYSPISMHGEDQVPKLKGEESDETTTSSAPSNIQVIDESNAKAEFKKYLDKAIPDDALPEYPYKNRGSKE